MPSQVASDPACTVTKPLRTVFVGSFQLGSTENGLVPGWRKLGWLVEEVDLTPFYRPGRGLWRKIERRLARPLDAALISKAIDAAIANCAPDLLFISKGLSVSPRQLRRAREAGIFIACLWPDCWLDEEAWELFAESDLIVTTKSFQVEEIGARLGYRRVALVHHGYSDAIHARRAHPADNSDFDVDVGYIGSHNVAKAHLLNALAAKIPELDMRIIGPGWRKRAPAVLQRYICDRESSGDYMARDILRSRINLAFHTGAHPHTGWADLVSTRTFEIPACGGFMLHVDNAEVQSLYSVPDEIDTFRDVEDLSEKIGYWLAHPALRMAVADRGHARAVPDYGYAQRGRDIALRIESKMLSRVSSSRILEARTFGAG